MPIKLRDLAAGAAVYHGVQSGIDKAEKREFERAERPYKLRDIKRRDEIGELEHEDKKRTIAEERGARDAATGAAAAGPEQLGGPTEDAPTSPVNATSPAASTGDSADLSGATTLPDKEAPGQPGRLGLAKEGEPLETQPLKLAGAGGGEAPASPVAPAKAEPSKVLWLRTAEAQRDYWIRKGRPERANKVMVDAYKAAMGENEARQSFELQPRQQKIRDLQLSSDELKAHQGYQSIQQEATQNQMLAAGKVWGLFKLGANKEALDLFNASGILQPGVKAASASVVKAKGPSGDVLDVLVLRDDKGNVVVDKSGQELIYPVAALDALHRQATTSTVTLNKGQSVYKIQTDPATGGTSAQPVVTAPDPEADRKAGREERIAGTAENTRRDRLRGQARDAVKAQLFAGQTMMDKVDPHKQNVHGRAAPIAERYVDNGMSPGDAASKAISEVEDAIKRERGGAGGKSGGGKPTVKDIIGG